MPASPVAFFQIVDSPLVASSHILACASFPLWPILRYSQMQVFSCSLHSDTRTYQRSPAAPFQKLASASVPRCFCHTDPPASRHTRASVPLCFCHGCKKQEDSCASCPVATSRSMLCFSDKANAGGVSSSLAATRCQPFCRCVEPSCSKHRFQNVQQQATQSRCFERSPP
jgi:hypothetical protein